MVCNRDYYTGYPLKKQEEIAIIGKACDLQRRMTYDSSQSVLEG